MASEDDSVAPSPSGDSEPFNVEGYARYRGRTMISRLLFIAERCSDPESQMDALRLAYMKIKRTEDTQLHRRVVKMTNGRLGPEYGLDQAWIDDVDRRMAHGKDELQKDVSDAQYRLYEEGIRRALADFGDFYYSHGHLADAFEKYVQSCDYCTTEDNTIQMYLRVILVSIELGQFSYVSHYADKAMKASCSLSPLTVGKLLCASALAYLHGKEYKLAACKMQSLCMICNL
ncbi:uncharacterized protein A4U43_C10F11040 [Asparagus officinalis]|uniref:26S proteasome regulatory subunit Rpn7 N-terminal domain-containing protein n=1 Tax=Asparagus officinalis TaxID=4686 RepID=A0A5P1E5A8_ASPOF|nr:uncharacterized protein A4U43_C10F11040 [Asparagus officinalis]